MELRFLEVNGEKVLQYKSTFLTDNKWTPVPTVKEEKNDFDSTIELIKRIRTVFGFGLVEAKRWVDAMRFQREHFPPKPKE